MFWFVRDGFHGTDVQLDALQVVQNFVDVPVMPRALLVQHSNAEFSPLWYGRDLDDGRAAEVILLSFRCGVLYLFRLCFRFVASFGCRSRLSFRSRCCPSSNRSQSSVAFVQARSLTMMCVGARWSKCS